MINVSKEFKQYMVEDKRCFLPYADGILADGTKLSLSNSDIWQNGFKINDGVSASGKFTIGSCIINKLTLTLNNIYDQFSPYDFDGATVTAYLGLQLSNSLEKIRKGVYTVDNPQYNGSTITLECLDNMSKLDKDYINVKTAYPATLGEIVADICGYCGVALATADFPNKNYMVSGRPEDEALTCRQVLSYCAQIACCFARFDSTGQLRLEWYKQWIFEKNDNLDGGIFDKESPYMSGDKADGGNFDDYSSGYSADGGSFDDLDEFHHLYSLTGFNVATDDVVITGIEVTEEFTETQQEKKETVLIGTPGYVLSIAGNKFIQKGQGRAVAEFLAAKLIGMKFRPMSTQVLGDPTIEAGDLAYVTDRKSNSYNCLITNLTFTAGNYMNVSCDAETPSKNSSKQYSEMTQAIVEARKAAQKQSSSLAAVMAQSFGVFKTEEAKEDGSIVYYMHNKPTLAESMKIWKFTADAFAVSEDGGKTWKAGLDVNGNATVNILSAIGINCDWIHAGTLTLGGYNNQNGKLVMQDANGNEQGRWTNGGIRTTGSITSDNPKDKNSIYINNGQCCVKGSDGSVYGYMTFEDDGIAIRSWGGSGNAEISLHRNGGSYIYGNAIYLVTGQLYSNGALGKTGTANFSDGSYMSYVNGIMVGGRTADGSTF